MELVNFLYQILVFWLFGSALSAFAILCERKSLVFFKKECGWLDAIMFFLVFTIGSFISIGAIISASQKDHYGTRRKAA